MRSQPLLDSKTYVRPWVMKCRTNHGSNMALLVLSGKLFSWLLYCRHVACDVAPIPRQILTRAKGFLDSLFSLTLDDKLIRRQATE